jgi:MFS family permease
MSFFKQTRPFQPPNGHSPASPRLRNIAYVYQLTTFVSLGTLLFGYDQGIMGVIVADDRWVSLTQPANSWVTGAVISLYDIGCFVGAMSVGILADSCGRERTLSLASVVFIIGAILQCASYSITQMILCTGELFAFWLNYGFAYLDTNDWWRIPLAIQILPAVLLGVGCWIWVPPSPRWLVQQDRHACAREILARLHGDVAAELEMAQIAERFDLERTPAGVSWLDMFRWPVLKVTLLGMGVQFFQQSTGTNSILYYTVCSPIHCPHVSLDTDCQTSPHCSCAEVSRMPIHAT